MWVRAISPLLIQTKGRHGSQDLRLRDGCGWDTHSSLAVEMVGGTSMRKIAGH